MLDAAFDRFGTLYSGGPFSSWSGADVGPTIDLWRLWRGLPDLRFRDAQQFDFMGDWGRDFSGFGNTADDLTLILRIAGRPQPKGLTEPLRYVAAHYLNKMVDAGSGPGWWLAPGPSDQTDRQQLVMAASTPGSLMEWLLVMMAQSDTPQAVAWVNQGYWEISLRDRSVALDRLTDLIRQRGTFEPGLEWQVAASTFYTGKTTFIQAVHNCTATDAEYAAHAVQVFHLLQRKPTRPDLSLLADLPSGMRNLAMAHLAMVAVRDLATYDAKAARANLDWITAHSPPPDFTRWLNVGRLWGTGASGDLAALTDGTAPDPRMIRALNLLSLTDMARFAQQANLPDDVRRRMFTVVAARAFVLGDQPVARRFMTDLRDLMPDYAQVINDALSGPGDAEVQNARALLALPVPTVWLRGTDWPVWSYVPGGYSFSDANLPLRYVSAAILNPDLQSWMAQPLASGRQGGFAWRAYRRGRHFHDTWPEPFVPEAWDRGDRYPFLRLIAWDQLGRLEVCHSLTQRLSQVLIRWADQGSDTWVERQVFDQTAFPETLRRIILLNKHNPGTVVDGHPAGQRAFALLSGRFADAPAARATKYWYHQDQGCEAQSFPPG
jgi:hypothetical protein